MSSSLPGVRMSLKAMILAAGRGERMRPLTDTPQAAAARPAATLIEHHIEGLARAGFRELVINHRTSAS